MGGYFEVVLFTDEPSAYAEPIINKLDPYRWVVGGGGAGTRVGAATGEHKHMCGRAMEVAASVHVHHDAHAFC